MTFIDGQSEAPTILQIVIFSIIAAAFIFCGIWVFYRAHTRRHYHRVYVVRFLFPIASLFCCVENIFLASSDYFIKRSQDSLNLHPMLKALFVLQAVQVPIYLVTIFELTYLIHKRRSVHFLGMYFDEGRLGRRVKGVFSTPFKSFLARNFIRILSTVLFATGIIVNFDILPRTDTVGDLAGKSGWWNVFREEGFAENVMISLIPTAILVMCSFVLSTALWRYGTSTSMIVHSSFLNPWFAPFFGTLALTVGQFFTAKWFAVTSNSGLLVYTITLILLMRQIDRDIVSFAEFTDFLHQVAKKGNEITVHNLIQASNKSNQGSTSNLKVAAQGTSLPDLSEEDDEAIV
mmetsp:Transcript_4931/g.6030  ORF Transcript_4931/g.6030 Transcript_4931/m.6030 type:complete len:347 (+) Transcript_4931:80-1120(+)